MSRLIVVCIFSISIGMMIGFLHIWFDYAHISCIIGAVILAHIGANQIKLDMDK